MFPVQASAPFSLADVLFLCSSICAHYPEENLLLPLVMPMPTPP
jgi:hypothetical protein